MKRYLILLFLLSGLSSLTLSAADTDGQQRSITRTYVSPGASGSVDESSRRQTGYGAYQAPADGYDSRSSYQGNSATQTRGNVQQSTEYPGVGEFQRQPGSRSVQRNQP